MYLSKPTLSLLAILLLFPVLVHAQAVEKLSDRQATLSQPYPNSPDGLRLQLQDLFAAAKDHNRAKLESLIGQLEIPDNQEWFTKTFGDDDGERWSLAYASGLTKNETDLEIFSMRHEKEDGTVVVRKVNDDQDPDMVVEADMIHALRQPAVIFFASWKRLDLPPNTKGDPIGYFVFLEGKFRWDGTINFLKIRPADETNQTPSETNSQTQSSKDQDNGPLHPGVDGVGFPSCSFCPDPEYPKIAKAKHLEGVVVMRAIIQPDGHATDLQVLKTPNAEFTESAREAVEKWRFKPARDREGQPVSVIVPIEVTFRLLN